MNNKLVGGAAFVVGESRLLGKRLSSMQLLSNSWIDRNTVLLATPDESVLSLIIEAIEDKTDVIEFPSLSNDSTVASLLPIVAKLKGFWYGHEEGLSSPYLPLPDSWEKLQSELSAAMRASIRRKLRKAEQSEGVKMEIVRNESCLAAIDQISPATWQGQAGTAMNSQADIWRMYQEIVSDSARQGSLVCGLLSVHGTPVAFDFNIRNGSVLHSLKLGFRAEYASLSPGVALKAFLLRNEIEMGMHRLTEYDFMGTDESYKRHWSPRIRGHGRHLLFRPRASLSISFASAYRLKPALREFSPRLISLLKHFRHPQLRQQLP
jgi:CelD/BcsL family acetyltransferase involved in cellulose biosynthesis